METSGTQLGVVGCGMTVSIGIHRATGEKKEETNKL